MPTPALGIDFGTSTTIAVLRRADGTTRPLLFDGTPLLPSAVYLETDGRPLTGRDAVHAARREPSRYEPSPKRRFNDGAVLLADREVPVVDLATAVLRRVAVEATRVNGAPVPEVTLTHPAEWGSSRRELLTDAARRAGLPRPRLVPEPVAAAHYFTEVLGQRIPVGSAVVVYDFGAGTFDASVVLRGTKGFEAAVVNGREVGGLDIDAAIVEWLGARYGQADPVGWRRLTAPTDTAGRRARELLWTDVRTCKEQLSRTSSATLAIPLLEVEAHLTRDELERLAAPIVDETVRATAEAIRHARVGTERIAGLFLVGGASRLPLAGSMLHRGLRVAPTAIEQPEVVVGEGSLRVPTAEQGGSHTRILPVVAPPASPAPGPAGPPFGDPLLGGPLPGGGSSGGGLSGGPLSGGVAAGVLPAGTPAGLAGGPVPPPAGNAAGTAAGAGPVQHAVAVRGGATAAPSGGTGIAQPGAGTLPAAGTTPGGARPVSGGAGPIPAVTPTPGTTRPTPSAARSAPGAGETGPGGAGTVPPHGTGRAPDRAEAAPRGAGSGGSGGAGAVRGGGGRGRGVPVNGPGSGGAAPARGGAVYGSSPTGPRTPGGTRGSGTRTRRTVLLAGVAVVLAVVLGAGGWYGYRHLGGADTDPPDGGAAGTGRPAFVPASWRLAVGSTGGRNGWRDNTSRDGTGSCTLADGALAVRKTRSATSSTGMFSCGGAPTEYTDVAVQTTVAVDDGCGGVWLRTGDTAGYFVSVCAGTATLYVLGQSGDPGRDNRLKQFALPDTGGAVTIGLRAVGADISVYEHRSRLGTVHDDQIAAGRVDLGVFADQGSATATFRATRVWAP